RKKKAGVASLRDIKEENPVLVLQDTEQSPASQDVFVSGQMTMMWLVTRVARRRQRDRPQHPAIVVWVFVEVDPPQKVRAHACLIARPDVESLFAMIAVFICIVVCLRKATDRQPEGHGYQTCHNRTLNPSLVHVRPPIETTWKNRP